MSAPDGSGNRHRQTSRLPQSHAWDNLNQVVLEHFAAYWVENKLINCEVLNVLNMKANSVLSENPDPDSLELANLCFGLAVLNYENKQFREAATFTEQSVTVRSRILGQSHRDLLNDYDVLVKSYWQSGEFERAEAAALSWRRLADDVMGEGDTYIAQILGLLARIYRAQDRKLEADQMYKHAIDIHEANNCLDCMDVEHIKIEYCDFVRSSSRVRSWTMPKQLNKLAHELDD